MEPLTRKYIKAVLLLWIHLAVYPCSFAQNMNIMCPPNFQPLDVESISNCSIKLSNDSSNFEYALRNRISWKDGTIQRINTDMKIPKDYETTESNKMILPNKWIVAYIDPAGPFSFVSWRSDFKVLSFGLLSDDNNEPITVKINETAGNCDVEIGGNYMVTSIVKVLTNFIREKVDLDKHDDYENIHLCYLSKFEWFEKSPWYVSKQLFGIPFQEFGYKCCMVREQTVCCDDELHRIEGYRPYPYIISIFVITFSPIIFLRFAIISKENDDKKSQKEDNKLSKEVPVCLRFPFFLRYSDYKYFHNKNNKTEQEPKPAHKEKEKENSQKRPLLNKEEEKENSEKSPLLNQEKEKENSEKSPLLNQEKEKENSQTSPPLNKEKEKENSQTSPPLNQEKENNQTSPPLNREKEKENSQKSPPNTSGKIVACSISVYNWFLKRLKRLIFLLFFPSMIYFEFILLMSDVEWKELLQTIGKDDLLFGFPTMLGSVNNRTFLPPEGPMGALIMYHIFGFFIIVCPSDFENSVLGQGIEIFGKNTDHIKSSYNKIKKLLLKYMYLPLDTGYWNSCSCYTYLLRFFPIYSFPIIPFSIIALAGWIQYWFDKLKVKCKWSSILKIFLVILLTLPFNIFYGIFVVMLSYSIYLLFYILFFTSLGFVMSPNNTSKTLIFIVGGLVFEYQIIRDSIHFYTEIFHLIVEICESDRNLKEKCITYHENGQCIKEYLVVEVFRKIRPAFVQTGHIIIKTVIVILIYASALTFMLKFNDKISDVIERFSILITSVTPIILQWRLKTVCPKRLRVAHIIRKCVKEAEQKAKEDKHNAKKTEENAKEGNYEQIHKEAKRKAKEAEKNAIEAERKAKKAERKTKEAEHDTNEAKTAERNAKEAERQAKVTERNSKKAERQAKEAERQAERKVREAEQKVREAERKAKEDELQRKEAELRTKKAELKTKEDEIEIKEVEIKTRERELKTKEDELNMITAVTIL